MDDHRIHLRPPVWLPLLVVLIAGGSYIVGKTIETRHMDSVTISVSGEGKVYANPDIAQTSFGVKTGRQKTAEMAMQILSTRMNAVIAAAKAAGIEEKDITTQRLNLRPAYDWDDGKKIDRGFEASQDLRVKVRDIAEMGTVLSAVAAAGANQVSDVRFTIDDPDALRQEARKKAIEQAERKARTLAMQLGATLGKLKGFSEGGNQPVYARALMEDNAMAVGGAEPLPVPAGEQEVSVSVNLIYELR